MAWKKKKKNDDNDLMTKVKYMKELFQFTWKGKQKKMSRYHGLGILSGDGFLKEMLMKYWNMTGKNCTESPDL